jgi:hypothetical protein
MVVLISVTIVKCVSYLFREIAMEKQNNASLYFNRCNIANYLSYNISCPLSILAYICLLFLFLRDI